MSLRKIDSALQMEEACCAFFAQFLESLPVSVVLLRGEPGAGKTTFCRGFMRAMSIRENINSPTFNLHNRYEGSRGVLHHYDLYRLQKVAELEELGFLEDWHRVDHAPTVHAIEWGDRALPHIGPGVPVFLVEISIDEKDDSLRHIQFYRRQGEQLLSLH
jgi:tRNA threonylcarbamoyladenosine biosynthesis protein TsaE